jgi:hypothetical protein
MPSDASCLGQRMLLCDTLVRSRTVHGAKRAHARHHPSSVRDDPIINIKMAYAGQLNNCTHLRALVVLTNRSILGPVSLLHQPPHTTTS